MPKTKPVVADLDPVATPDPLCISETSAAVPDSLAVINPPRQTKTALLREMLSRPGGASLQAIMAATGWQAHTVRAALSGLRKTGVEIIRMTSQAGTVYTASVAVDAAIKSSDDQVTNTRARHKTRAASHVSTHVPASPIDTTHPDVAL